MERKKESERIERENLAFAKRLLEKESVFSKKTLEEDFKRHLKYKSQVLHFPESKYFLRAFDNI